MRSTKKRYVSYKISIKRTQSNVFATVSGLDGRVFKVFSTGNLGFKNTRKDTPYAAESVGKAAAKFVSRGKKSMRTAALVLQSPLDSRLKSVLQGIAFFRTFVRFISVTSTFSPAHNGCRPRKSRRV